MTRVWFWRKEDLFTATCRRLDRNLSWIEWQQYIGGEPYHKTCLDLPIGEDVPREVLSVEE